MVSVRAHARVYSGIIPCPPEKVNRLEAKIVTKIGFSAEKEPFRGKNSAVLHARIPLQTFLRFFPSFLLTLCEEYGMIKNVIMIYDKYNFRLTFL